MISEKKQLYELILPSTEFVPDPVMIRNTIRFEYSRDDIRYRGGIRFPKMAAIMRRAERCATAWHIEEAYDTLVQIEGSSWAEQVRADTSSHLRDTQKYNHYLIILIAWDRSRWWQILGSPCRRRKGRGRIWGNEGLSGTQYRVCLRSGFRGERGPRLLVVLEAFHGYLSKG